MSWKEKFYIVSWEFVKGILVIMTVIMIISQVILVHQFYEYQGGIDALWDNQMELMKTLKEWKK